MFTYESVLRAIGQDIDRKEVVRFTIRETETGIAIDGFDRHTAAPVSIDYTLSDISQIVSENEIALSDTSIDQSTIEAHTLKEFLAKHQVLAAQA